MPGKCRLHTCALTLQILNVIDRLLGQGQPQARLSGYFRGQGADIIVQRLARRKAIDHAHLIGTLSGHFVAGKQELFGNSRRHFKGMGEILNAGDAHANHRITEKSIICRNNNIADPGQHQTASDTGTLHCRNGRLGNLAPTTAHAEIGFSLAHIEILAAGLVGMVIPHASTLLAQVHVAARGANIMAGRKVFAIASEDNNLNLIVGHCAPKGGV